MIEKIKCFFAKRRVIAMLAVVILAASAIGGVITGSSIAVNEEDGIKLPIIMYHSILKSAKVQTKYIVTPEQFEADLIWIKNNGYTSIFMSDLISYVYEGTELPEKPIIITFDDGYYNNLVYMYPLLVKYDMKAVVSIVGSYSEIFSNSMDLNPSYAHLTWDNIKEMSESGYVEFQNHSYEMHSTKVRKGCKIMANESYDEYKSKFCSDVMRTQILLTEKCSITPNTFTYPYGYICDESEELLKELGFKASLSCYEKLNYITRDKDCLYSLKRFNRDSTLSTERFMSKIK